MIGGRVLQFADTPHLENRFPAHICYRSCQSERVRIPRVPWQIHDRYIHTRTLPRADSDNYHTELPFFVVCLQMAIRESLGWGHSIMKWRSLLWVAANGLVPDFLSMLLHLLNLLVFERNRNGCENFSILQRGDIEWEFPRLRNILHFKRSRIPANKQVCRVSNNTITRIKEYITLLVK